MSINYYIQNLFDMIARKRQKGFYFKIKAYIYYNKVMIKKKDIGMT